MQVDPQLSTVLTKAKKANIMSSFKVNASLPESQGQDLGGQGQGLRGQGQGLGLRGQSQGPDLPFQGQGHANLASRRLEAKAVASRTTSLGTDAIRSVDNARDLVHYVRHCFDNMLIL